MHDRISVNNLCFVTADLASDIESWRLLEAPRIGVYAQKLMDEGWEPSLERLAGAGLRVETLVHPCYAQLDDDAQCEAMTRDLSRTLEAGRALGARSVYTSTGGRGRLTWEEAAERFRTAVAPCLEQARRADIELLTEPAPPVYADAYFIHSLRDTVLLAEQAGIGVCIDVFSCWTEAQLRETIRRAMPRCHLVQLGDYSLGDRGFPCRSVLGEGSIPLERILGWILEAGYTGAFDLELMGPRIDELGHREAAARSAQWLDDWLARAGA